MDARAEKISRTMKRKRLDNFRSWREEMKEKGLILKDYPKFKKSGDLAEYIGVMLGDGNITKFPRTECLIISANSNNPGFVQRYADITFKVFNKKPVINKIKDRNNIKIRIYQKEISKRLRIPSGNRKDFNFKIPFWIKNNKEFTIRLIRGLFEAEGSLSIHPPTSTYNFQFSNKNKSLLDLMENTLKLFGFHPERRINAVRLRRRLEVEIFRKLIKFREY